MAGSACLGDGRFSRYARRGVLHLHILAKEALQMYGGINNCEIRNMLMMKYTHAFLRILSLSSPSLDVASSAIASRSSVWQASSIMLDFSSSRSTLEADLMMGSATGFWSSSSSPRGFGAGIRSSSITRQSFAEAGGQNV